MKTVQCPHYNSDGYAYDFNRIEFLFCEKCNDKLFKQMVKQKKLEDQFDLKKLIGGKK